MSRWLKFLVGVLLLPLCAGGAWTLWHALRLSAGADTVWVALAAGAGCWLTIYLLLPKPIWVYVVGHELTHAIWTWMMGGKVKKFKASSQGGHVVVTRNNFLIALAPYFFPLYAILVMAAFAIGKLMWDLQPHVVWFHLALGAAYCFHVTLTFHALKTSQSDITSQGYLFSAVVIFLGNLLVFLLALPLLTGTVAYGRIFGLWGALTVQLIREGAHWVHR